MMPYRAFRSTPCCSQARPLLDSHTVRRFSTILDVLQSVNSPCRAHGQAAPGEMDALVAATDALMGRR